LTRPLLVLFALITIFYARLASPAVSIHWDAGGYFYPYQKYFSDSLRAGDLPFWTSAIFSGFPFLADMQVAAWYPPHWLLYLAGLSPKSLFVELWLHSLLAGWGAFLLARRLAGSATAGMWAGMCYALSGYGAAHAQHVGLFVAASWLPLLLDLLLTADTPRRRAALALAGGCFCLAGHFQTVLYGFSAAALVTLWRWRRERRAAVWLPLAVLVGGGLALSAVQVLPSAELVAHSLRLRLSSAQIAAGAAEWRSLLTLAWPNAVGTFDQPYPGPRDISQHYFYSGLLLLPLSAWGLRDRRVRSLALVLIVPAGLYALGPQGPVFWLAGRLPGFAHVRAPSHAMGMVLLGLALLAGAGAAALFQNHRRLSWILLLGAFGDLFYWNMWRTPLVYDRAPWEQTYGAAERWFREQVGPQQPLERFASPGRWEHIYPSQAPFGLGIESAAGDNPLVLARYHAYLEAMGGNPRLMSGLGVSRYFDPQEWVVRSHAPVLPRFHFPPMVHAAATPDESRRRLASLDPAREGVAEGLSGIRRNPLDATAQVLAAASEAYELRIETPTRAVLRIAIPSYPGWRAEIDGTDAVLFPMDHALMGLEVPAGVHRLRLAYRQNGFGWGAGISLLALAGCVWGMGRRS
jgi:hypothetical protein